MKERISNEIYVACGRPITEILWNGCRDCGDIKKVLFVNPIIGKPFIGSERIIGAVEAISKKKIFSYAEYGDNYGTCESFYDVEGPERKPGDIEWKANFLNEANRIVPTEVLEEYFSKSPEEISQEIDQFREDCREYAKTNTFTRVLK